MMLRPQDSATRETKSLVGLWRFRPDAEGVGRRERWFAGDLPSAIDLPVPASYNDIVPGSGLRNHMGDVWYQRTVRVPRGWDGERIVVRFESATHRAAVWVGEREVVSHEGGYTPFEAEISQDVRAGELIRITAAVDNRLSWGSIPPGIVVETDHGPQQRYMHDFFNYAGLHRPVWLYCTPATYIADIAVRADVSGTVEYEILAGGGRPEGIRAAVYDHDGRQVAAADGATGRLEIASPRLWEPGEGYQYVLAAELYGPRGTVLDAYEQRFGIRSVEVRGTEFLINGRPFYFKGFGMHEDHVVRGKGHDAAEMVHDFELLAWTGANSFRTSHYPYSEDVMDYADAHGVVVIDEAAAVGMNADVARVLGTPIEKVFSPETVNALTREVHAQAIRELIARDKNRPSVVLWSIANEPESHTDEAVEYFEPLFALARNLDPSRPVGFVNQIHAPAGRCKLARFSDVLMINRYYGWYRSPGDLEQAEIELERELAKWAEQGKPIVMTEYGADAVAGLHSLDGSLWTEEFQAESLATYHRVFDRQPAVVGEHVWNFADFQTSPSFVRVDGNKKGVFTRDRRPKAAAHLLRRRWRSQPARLSAG
jgi:beta-glucuronidase